MYLSRLHLNPRSRQVQRELGSPYEMHRTLMSAFPDRLDGQERLLFRVDETRDGLPLLLVQSQLAPDWGRLKPGYLLAPAESKPFDLQLAAGQQLAFRLRANPTVKKQFDGPGTPSKRIGLYTEEEQLAWLERKLQAGGFRLLHTTVGGKEDVGGKTRSDEQGRRHDLNLFGIRFDGLLAVIEPETAAATVAQGIGSGKAFGFGLLSLARPA